LIPSLYIAVRSPALWLAIAVAVLCIGLQALGLAETWRFDRQQIDEGAWYLLLSGNFVHFGTQHLWMNMLGFGFIVALVWQHFNVWEWLIVVVFASLAVGIGLYFRDPHILWYVGFSGTLHALMVAGSLADLKHYPKTAGLLLVLVAAKLTWEQIGGALPGSEEMAGGSVAVNSHLYGAVAGAVIAPVLLARQFAFQPVNRSDRATDSASDSASNHQTDQV
jgi:rhomboid family GlyGly-CTERM serine protease